MSKKHFGFQALYEAEQAKEQRRQQQLNPDLDLKKDPTSLVADQALENGRPIGRPFEDRTSETDVHYRTSDQENRTSVSEGGADTIGHPLLRENGRPIDKEAGGRSRADKRQKKKITVRYNESMEKEIREFCAKHKLELQDFHELAASYYIQATDARCQQEADVRSAEASGHRTSGGSTDRGSHDDLMIFKTHDDIIMLYRELTDRRWTAADDRAASRFNDTDRRLVELGMIHTYIQARGKRINSFAYFIPEIQTMIDVKFDRSNLDVYLKARRKLLAELMKKQGKEPINLDNHSEESK